MAIQPVHRSRSFLAAAALLALGCTPAPELAKESGPPVQVGVVVATMLDDTNGYPLTRPIGMARDREGRMWIADLEENALYALDSMARPIARVGRKGAGPGEFQSPCCLAMDAKGRLWVRDLGNMRYDVLTMGDTAVIAVPAFTVRFGSTAQGYTARTVFDSAGRVIDAAPDPKSDDLLRLTLDTAGVVVQRITTPVPTTGISKVAKIPRNIPGGTSVNFVYPPFPGYALHASGVLGEAAAAGSGDYRVRWYAGDGTLLREITRADPGPAVTPAERAEADSAMRAEAREYGTTPAALGFSMPERKPVLRDIWFDGGGRLWVSLSVETGAPHRAHVYGRDGTLVFTAEWPSNVALDAHSFIRGDEAWGVAHDADNVPSIVRMRFAVR